MTQASRNDDAGTSGNQRKPGDEDAAGTPQTADNTCPRCGGSGKNMEGGTCDNCAGTGTVTEIVGDA
ncbi:hypothetical protein SAMN06265795_101258 [Noviherbaspirillum humi]|uniref:Uncharacterized protein n=1 Tax=Noviherbaspirillum humi TaxID=1688639 RepID=A0A239C6N5_9BURK|nr:hypothetical protein [Noviherbaspirillum humi]SNS15094.1 hypothetical protein SAMN06265795_101258 [Noviherbaspirillum humi]